MITLSQSINNRKIHYLNIGESLDEFKSLELKNWVLLVIEDNIKNPILNDFANLCIDKNVLYVCASGKACSEVDDLFDFSIIDREEKGEGLPAWYVSEEDVLMTSWHYDLEEGFWFVTKVASYEDQMIDKVVVVNLTEEDHYPTIRRLAVESE